VAPELPPHLHCSSLCDVPSLNPTCACCWLWLYCTTLQGFSQLKVLRNGRQVSCFVEFDTIEAASQCHTTQQVSSGARVYSC